MPSATKSRSRSRTASKSTSSKGSASKSPKEVTDGGLIANNRAAAGHRGHGVVAGKVDNMTRRSAADAIEGHFVYVDHTASGLSKEAKDALGNKTGYGVYLEPAEVDSGGFPKTAIVRLRDSSSQRIVVPYDALSPVDPTDRRP